MNNIRGKIFNQFIDELNDTIWAPFPYPLWRSIKQKFNLFSSNSDIIISQINEELKCQD